MRKGEQTANTSVAVGGSFARWLVRTTSRQGWSGRFRSSGPLGQRRRFQVQQGLCVNPYLSAGLAMCGVLFISLALTAYLAVYFNRRAKADLQAALDPLAARIDGSVDIETAQVSGRYERKLVIGRMTNAEGGPVRVFQIDVIDSAGGTGWMYVSLAPKKDGTARTHDFRLGNGELEASLSLLSIPDLPALLGARDEWIQVEYSPEAGYVRMTRPMGTRKDLPDPDAFVGQVEWLSRLADQNRALQERSGTVIARPGDARV